MDFFNLARRQTDTTGYYGSDGDPEIATGSSGGDLFLSLIANPFSSQVQTTSFYAALAYSFLVGAGMFFLFCFLRPRVEWIYAPRAKHADAKHAPPPTSSGFFGWWPTLKAVKETELAEKIGLDAVIFLRVLKMIRNIFICLAVVGCAVLIPVNLSAPTRAIQGQTSKDLYVFIRVTPLLIYGNTLWAFVIVLYVFNGIIYYFLWRNYRAVSRLRRTYFASVDYRNSLHSRTLLISHIPKAARTEDGVIQIVREGKAVEDIPNISVARNVKELPQMIEEHEETVKKLESVLSRYLSNPNQLPAQRPLCKPSKHDKGRSQDQKVDAIDYLTDRIKELELEINETRQTVDQRNPHPYGFASYTHIEDAHASAFAMRKGGPQGTTVKLAPKPHDLIWKNLPMTGQEKRTQTFWNGVWMVLLTIAYIPINVIIAVFLSNLHNLGQVWEGFNESLYAHPTGWAIAQGIVAPGLQILFYYFLPAIFRRLLMKSGDTTKTQRERHVTSKLYGFFVFNNLIIFSVFGTAFAYIATIVNAKDNDVWDTIKRANLAQSLSIGLCNISPYWVTWQLQRNLGAAIDILQAWPLIKNYFLRKFTNPTPREVVELTAPQPFEYADYYNNYLFVATVGLAMGLLQPLILPITALYITIDAWFKKYLLQYIFITKVESGGSFWRMLFNRFLFATLLMNVVIGILVGGKGTWNPQIFVMVPLVPIMAGFKWYCSYAFDADYSYYTTKSFTETEVGTDDKAFPERKHRSRKSGDRVGVRFGHPALYKKLMTPMVNSKSQQALKQVYRGRLDDDDEPYDAPGGMTTSRPNSVFGYSDIYMNEMSTGRLGKTKHQHAGNTPYELVNDSQLDFENFKRRSDFRAEYGGDGELYGRPEDQVSRPGTPSSMMSFGASTLMDHKPGVRSRSESPATRDPSRGRITPGGLDGEQHTYPRGYANLARADSPARSQSPARRMDIDIPDAGLGGREISTAGLEAYRDEDTLSTYEARRMSQGSMGGMLQNASGMGRTTTPSPGPGAGAGRMARKPVGSQPGILSPEGPGSRSQSPGREVPARRRQSPGPSSGLGRYQYGEGGGAGSGLMGSPAAEDEYTSYDYFRRGRR